MKKILSIVLTLVMLFSLSSTAFAETESCNCSNVPIIYIFGKQNLYFLNENGTFQLDENGNRISVTDKPVDIKAMAGDLLPKFVKAYATNDFSEWGDSFLSYILPLYEGIGVHPNGEIIDKDLKKYDNIWAKTSLCRHNGKTHGYEVEYSNPFYYDFRKSPVDVAA